MGNTYDLGRGKTISWSPVHEIKDGDERDEARKEGATQYKKHVKIMDQHNRWK